MAEELEQYQIYYDNQEEEKQRQCGDQKKNQMMQQIQNLVGELGGSRKPFNNIQMNRQSRISRVGNQDSDLSCFSIKDGVNRPSNLNFY